MKNSFVGRIVVRGLLALPMLLALLGAAPHAQAASNCTVAASGATYSTIQAAVNDSGCAVINVAAGTYTENVTISRDVTINGASQDTTIVDGANAGTVFRTDSTSVTLANLTIQHGKAEFGSGIDNFGTVTLKNSTISSNTATYGGGIYNQGTLTVQDSTLSNNSATTNGGGINNADATVTITNSTISGNSATSDGGGIYNQNSTVNVTNSTISTNSASYGGGIENNYHSQLTLTNSTISTNSASQRGGGIDNGGSMTLVNTIVTGSSDGDCTRDAATTNSHNNLIEDANNSCALTDGMNGNIVGQKAQLGPLQGNGGPTETHALLAGSPAIDAASAADCPSTDQRGEARPQGAGCDMGAYEFQMTYTWTGFLQPIDNLPTVNTAKAGSAVPVKFSLGGNQGLQIFAAGSPASQKITCDNSAPVAEVEQTASAGAGGLQYDAASDTYSYVWKTDKAWAGSCRQLTVTLIDGTTHTASFKFK